jgi:hypothetical protein
VPDVTPLDCVEQCIILSRGLIVLHSSCGWVDGTGGGLWVCGFVDLDGGRVGILGYPLGARVSGPEGPALGLDGRWRGVAVMSLLSAFWSVGEDVVLGSVLLKVYLLRAVLLCSCSLYRERKKKRERELYKLGIPDVSIPLQRVYKEILSSLACLEYLYMDN